jgi:aspartokinase-like uncharacterized kinase
MGEIAPPSIVKPSVVKLGGSLAEGGGLARWLDVVARHGGRRCVVVAGGGAFADAVRAAQIRHRFSDGAGHRMALLAMEQLALMLADLAPSLTPAATEAAIAAARAAGRIPVWLPSRMVLADPTIAESWDVTSDSLAAWLAHRLAARRLVLVKSAPPPPGGPVEWAAAGYVDAAFPHFTRALSCAILCLGPGEEDALAAALE